MGFTQFLHKVLVGLQEVVHRVVIGIQEVVHAVLICFPVCLIGYE